MGSLALQCEMSHDSKSFNGLTACHGEAKGSFPIKHRILLTSIPLTLPAHSRLQCQSYCSLLHIAFVPSSDVASLAADFWDKNYTGCSSVIERTLTRFVQVKRMEPLLEDKPVCSSNQL